MGVCVARVDSRELKNITLYTRLFASVYYSEQDFIKRLPRIKPFVGLTNYTHLTGNDNDSTPTVSLHFKTVAPRT